MVVKRNLKPTSNTKTETLSKTTTQMLMYASKRVLGVHQLMAKRKKMWKLYTWVVMPIVIITVRTILRKSQLEMDLQESSVAICIHKIASDKPKKKVTCMPHYTKEVHAGLEIILMKTGPKNLGKLLEVKSKKLAIKNVKKTNP